MSAESTSPLPPIDAVCWQCGAPARPEHAWTQRLVADAHSGLPALDYPVKRGDRQDEVTVRVPRCAQCRRRTRMGIGLTLAAMIAGAILGAIVQNILWPAKTHAPSFAGTGDVGNSGAGVGLLAGFVVGMFGLVVGRRSGNRRPLTTYPPLMRLRDVGWEFPAPPGN